MVRAPAYRGSSPQVRGARLDCSDSAVRRGLIPAGAGSTFSCSPWEVRHWAHPRRCGEHLAGGPRHRGGAGLIPAGAGSTAWRVTRCRSGWAHPRRCGEHADDGGGRTLLVGSSPQVRGAPGPPACRSAPRRLIPAGAGSTRRARWLCGGAGAHPRRCGEHTSPTRTVTSRTGSSPQVRGARRPGVMTQGRRGLIPAGAGSTLTGTPPRRGSPAHPRRCGEHRAVRRASALLGGSSPQVRGARRIRR